LLVDRFYSQRSYFLVDADGIIRWLHVESNPNHKREDAELLEAIDRVV
jgi:peroxiredoxin